MIGVLLVAALAANAAARPVVVVNDVTDPVSLDPHREFDASSDNVVNQIFDGLVRLTADGKVAAALAVSWRRIDPLTMEFLLRRGVAFHDGEPFTADAVVFSVARQLDARSPAPNAGLLCPIVGAEAVGTGPFRFKAGRRGRAIELSVNRR